MTTQEFLELAYVSRERVLHRSEQIEKLEAIAYRSTANMDSVPGGNPDPHAREKAVAALADEHYELDFDFQDYLTAQADIANARDVLYPDHMDVHAVVTYRYLMGWSWARIAAKMDLRVPQVLALRDKAFELIKVPEKYQQTEQSEPA